MNTDRNLSKHYLFILIGILIVTFIPFLGDTLFNTKGEPREAIVAMSMLDSGNWILPESYGNDIPYKPPFLAWCISAVSLVTGGVSEFTSRFPSAIALIVMALSLFWFYARRVSPLKAMATALITITSFEVYRAGVACRVDMLLTACIVGALLAFYRHWERGCRGLSWWAIVLMSFGVLTKGPVGMLLPCMVIGVFRLMKGARFMPTFLSLVASGLLACVLPALWYIAAYNQGGDSFMTLALEENFGRFFGNMSYESHENPIHYNFITVIAGLLPYTILLLLSLFVLRYSLPEENGITAQIKRLWARIRKMDSVNLFSLLSIVLIFVFYCIPKSKRSVYLLPIYPFIAYFITLLVVWLIRERKSMPIKVYGYIIGCIAVITPIVYVTINFVDFSVGEKVDIFINGLREYTIGIVGWVMIALSLISGLVLVAYNHKVKLSRSFSLSITTLLTVYWSYSYVYQPAVLNVKSDKIVAEQLQCRFPEAPIYTHIDAYLMRYYTLNYYMNDRLRLFDEELPQKGLLLLNETESEVFVAKHDDNYNFLKLHTTSHRSCDTRDNISVYSFSKED